MSDATGAHRRSLVCICFPGDARWGRSQKLYRLSPLRDGPCTNRLTPSLHSRLSPNSGTVTGGLADQNDTQKTPIHLQLSTAQLIIRELFRQTYSRPRTRKDILDSSCQAHTSGKDDCVRAIGTFHELGASNSAESTKAWRHKSPGPRRPSGAKMIGKERLVSRSRRMPSLAACNTYSIGDVIHVQNL